MRSPRQRLSRFSLTAALVASVLVPVVAVTPASPAAAATLPSGFQEQVVFTGLVNPTNIEFAPDGRIFVLEKRGTIKVFDNLADTTPTLFADLSTKVMDYWDRGALGLALDPNFPASPYVYVSYTVDAGPGQTPPVWNDACANPTGTGCVVTSRVSRLTAAGNVMTGSEQVLLTDWCQQFPSHSIGDLHFGSDGMLYVTGGDGASFNDVDYGQLSGNPCGDPTKEGGALRAQDSRSTTDPTGLDGTLLRIDPATGAAAAGNANIGSADLNTRRIVAMGLRNPFRFTFRPGSNEPWIGDVGWNTWEEINRVTNPTGAVANFGWPCYEGSGTNSGYQSASLPLCQSLTSQNAPYYAYNHSNKVVTNEACPTGGSSITGLAFYPTSGGNYPAAYAGSLFFADYSRNCIWAMQPASAGGLPSTSNIVTFASSAATPVDLNVGPGNELYYVDLTGGTIRRIRYNAGNQPPQAALSATPTAGSAPLAVAFSAVGSTDPDPADQGLLTYQWDFTNDGTTDATTQTANFTYTTNGNYTAKLTVRDSLGATDTKTVAIQVGLNSPVATITTPAAGTTWKVGDTINFSGSATDPQDGVLPAASLSWQLRLQHCATNDTCHVHVIQNWTGVTSGSFTAPDHEYPSYLELVLTATDSNGNSNNLVRRLDPQTVALNFATNPSGLQLAVGSTAQATPFTRTVIVGSTVSISAPTPQTSAQSTYAFNAWSDNGAQTHVITAGAQSATYTASYTGTSSCTDTFGYVCTDGARTFIPADQTVLNLTGDDELQQITLPFAVPFYGGSYTNAWVDTNGVMSFAQPAGSAWNHSGIPSAAADGKTNLAVYPFWDDLWIDNQGSIRTAVTGTAPNRQFIVEWRNARWYNDTGERLNFEVQISEAGVITFAYSGVDAASQSEMGASATIGIENGAGTVAIQYSANQAVLVSGNGVTFTPPGGSPPPPPPSAGTISGTVTDAGSAVAGATVTLGGTGRTTTTAANGSYTFTSVTPATYTVSASTAGSLCTTKSGSTSVTVVASQTATGNIAITGTAKSDQFGYVCSDGARTFVPADQTVLTLTGDDEVQQITLPFAIPFYGGSYTSAWVDTNGVVSFAAPPGSAWDHGAIPSAAANGKSNLAAYPFWDDLWIDSQSSIRTASSGTAPNRQFIVEWRNARFYNDANTRLSFEVIFSESGAVTFAYSGIDAGAVREQGNGATVGIENGAGTIALQYSLNQAVLVSGNGVTFTPPGSPPPPPPPPPPSTGTVTGTVTDAGAAVSGATVRLNSTLTAITAANGTYSIASVPAGSYTASVTLPATGCGTKAGSTPVSVTSGATATANIAIVASPVTDGFGYTCSVGTASFVLASTVVPLTGDDEIAQITLPFPVKFYGATYTTAWLDTNGVMSFAAPPGSAWDHGAIPSAAASGKSNLAVYPFWDDLWVDSSSSIRTLVTGTAPNRQFIVEWRNVRMYNPSSQRVDFEVSFSESTGAITFTYNNIDAVAREQGGAATVGIENANGTIALQYSLNQPVLRTGTRITFTPPA